MTFLSQSPPSADPLSTAGTLGSASAASITTGTSATNAGSIATFLNSVFGNDSSNKFAAQAMGNGKIILTGSSQQVFEAKRLLAEAIDVPFPQVRVKTWAIQLNELKNHAQEDLQRMRTIELGISEARVIENALTQDIGDWAYSRPLAPGISAIPELPFACGAFGPTLWSRSYAPLKLALVADEDLPSLPVFIKMPLFPEKNPTHLNPAFASLDLRDKELRDSKQLTAAQLKQLESLRASILKRLLAGDQVLCRYEAERRKHLPSAAWSLLQSLVSEWKNAGGVTGDPEKLQSLDYDAEKLVSGLTNAWSEDIADLVYAPLTDWADNLIARSPDGSNGVDSSDTLAIAVTSGQPTSLTAWMQETRSFTPPSQLTGQNIQDLLGLAGHATAPGTALIGLLSTPPPDPIYLSLAPGISVGLVPTVLPDESEARIQVSLDSAVSPGDATTSKGVAPDAVTRYGLSTDVRVAADDLFGVSTLDGQTTALGDVSWQIPVLDEIPLIGPMFRGPRRQDTKVHKALVLLNVGIVPTCQQMLAESCPTKLTSPLPKTGGGS